MSSIKTVYQGEIRRFRLDESKPFADLRAQFVKLYKLNEGCELLCKYQDDESEWVTVTSDVELIEAMRLCSQAVCLKLHVAVDGAPQSAPAIAHTTAPTAPKVVEEDKKAKSALPPTPLPSSPSQEALEKKRMIKEKQQIRFAASASPQVQAMVQDLLQANRHMVDSFATVTVENEDGEPVALVDNNNEAEGEEAATTNATGAAVTTAWRVTCAESTRSLASGSSAKLATTLTCVRLVKPKKFIQLRMFCSRSAQPFVDTDAGSMDCVDMVIVMLAAATPSSRRSLSKPRTASKTRASRSMASWSKCGQ